MQIPLKKALTLLFALFASMPAWAQADEGRAGYWHYGMDWDWGHMGFGWLMMIALWGGIIVLVILAVRWIGTNLANQTPPKGRSAIDTLKERFASGEIEKDEYEDRMKILSG